MLATTSGVHDSDLSRVTQSLVMMPAAPQTSKNSTSLTVVGKHFRIPHHLRLIYHFLLPCSATQCWHSTHLHSCLLSRLQIRGSIKGFLPLLSPQCICHAHLNPSTLASIGQNINFSVSFSPSIPPSSSKKMDFPLPFHHPSGGTKPQVGP